MATKQDSPSGPAATSASTLRYARERAGLSVRTAASRAGVSRSTLSAYERGARTPSLDRLCDILEALGFAIYLELEPRVRERNGVARGEELLQVIRLAEQFPPRERPEINFLAILRDAAGRRAVASAEVPTPSVAPPERTTANRLPPVAT